MRNGTEGRLSCSQAKNEKALTDCSTEQIKEHGDHKLFRKKKFAVTKAKAV